MVSGFEDLIEALELPDQDDRHVLAAAIRAGAQAIVTFNLADFPSEKLASYNIEVKHPDDFVLDAIDLAPGLVTAVVSQQAKALRSPPRSVAELLDTLRDQGLVRSVAKLRELLGAADPINSPPMTAEEELEQMQRELAAREAHLRHASSFAGLLELFERDRCWPMARCS